MREYVLIMLNMIDKAGMYLKKKKKQSTEYARILNVSDAVNSDSEHWTLITSKFFILNPIRSFKSN